MFRPRRADLPPAWLIVGLGNPGPEYARTRHNVGFEVVEEIASRAKIRLDRAKHKARYGVGPFGGSVIALAKPLTFMNGSGDAVRGLLREFGLESSALLVIADDLDLPVGRLRMRESGGAGGHNGHRDIIAKLGGDQYPRLRIGIGGTAPERKSEHVLSRFAPDERAEVIEAIRRTADVVETLVREGIAAAMNRANGV